MKKLSENGALVVTALVFCFGFISALCLVLPAFNLVDQDGIIHEILGMSAIFGTKTTNYDFNFNYLGFLAYFACFVGTTLVIIGFFKHKRFLYYISIVLFVISTALIIFEKDFFLMVNKEIIYTSISYLFGPIIGMISSALALLTTICLTIFSRK